jgi:hypothetical protein
MDILKSKEKQSGGGKQDSLACATRRNQIEKCTSLGDRPLRANRRGGEFTALEEWP